MEVGAVSKVFNKLYSQVSSSVSTTVSQLSGVLPGNPVTREFDAHSHIASGGPGLLWKIYSGCKKSTKQEAAIFLFEKRQLDKFSRAERDTILDALRRGVSQLTKIRHPRVLTVQHPLEESRESLAFATEPVFASLANVLGQTVNMPQPANMSDYKLYDIEIKYGLLQLVEGLTFLHNDVKLLHRNICPETVIINKSGAWKLFGLDFCIHNSAPHNLPPSYPAQADLYSAPTLAQPSWDFSAPECALEHEHGTSSDIFALGMLIYVLYSEGHEVLCGARNLQDTRRRVQQLAMPQLSGRLRCLPESLREHLGEMLDINPTRRPTAQRFIKISYFEDVGVKTLVGLDSLLQCTNVQRSQFYKGLPDALSKLPHRVRVQQALPCLTRDLVQPAMVPFVLPNMLDIAQGCTEQEFVENILPHLKPVMKLLDPIQILLIFLQRMELLLKLTPAVDIQQHVLPMLYRGLDSDTPQIHELCLTILPTFANLLDQASTKNSVLPRIKRLCLSSSALSVRVSCLVCIGQLLDHLDKWLVVDEVLPFLPQVPSREPAVLMGILGIYKMTLSNDRLGISKEVVATRVLPFLIPLCIENGLSLSQFNAFVTLVKQMFQQVEHEHRSKLEQLNSVQQEQKKLENTMMPVKLNDSLSSMNISSLPTPHPNSVLRPTQTTLANTPSKPKDLTRTLTDLDSLLWSNTDLKPSQKFYKQPSHSFQGNSSTQWSATNSNTNWNGFPSVMPLSPQQSNLNSQPVASLSKDDIMDLLS